MKLVADINIPYLKGVLEPFFDKVVYLPGNLINRDTVHNADALLIRTRTRCNANLLEGSTVKFIGSATIGYDHIDTDFCNSRGIEWVNAPGCNSGAVQQWVAASLLHISKTKGINLKDKTLGIVGIGNVGKKVVAVGHALGMKVLCCDPPRKRNENLSNFVTLAAIAQQSDFVTFHVPLAYEGEDATYHLVDKEFLSSLKEGAVLFNSSRGEVVNTQSLIEAIKSTRLTAVALDVWESEPDISIELLKRVDIATPHIAGYSLEGKVNGTRMVVDSLSHFFNLGIHPWTPEQNPLVKKDLIHNPKSIPEAIEMSYDIMGDDCLLRNTQYQFESIRSDYHFRREFSGFIVNDADESLKEYLLKLGFGINNR